MYVPRHFAVDEATTRELLTGMRAGDLVTATEDGLVATYLPLLYDADRGEHGVLLGHVARNNDQWKRPPVGQAMVIARGPDGYVSPAWYATKAEHGRVVPTWNYVTVHAYGELVVHNDVQWLDALVRRLTDRHERGRAHPWSVDDVPERYYAGQLRAIVGLELLIDRVEAKLKLSQNRSDADIDGVVAGLTEDGDVESARLVQRFRPAVDRGATRGIDRGGEPT
jgi:transcriptional regulator